MNLGVWYEVITMEWSRAGVLLVSAYDVNFTRFRRWSLGILIADD